MSCRNPGAARLAGALGGLLWALGACGGGGGGGGETATPTETPTPVDPPSRPVPCTFANSTCAERVEIASGLFLPVFSTHLLSEGHPGVTQALIVVHGNNRNADDYFESGFTAAAEARLGSSTVVVSPHFQTDDDGPESDEPFWSSPGWKRGNLSRPEGPSPRVSSYAALETVVEQLLDAARFPAVQRITVTGHSAGGQVLHRFAASSLVEEGARDGVSFRYVVANPSTYLYIGPERLDRNGEFTVPGGGCDDYDEWHYGLQDRNSYASRLEADTIRALLTRRDVRILVGDADTLSASLDQSCGANLQGPDRYRRGLNLVRFMEALYEENAHREMVVPGVGHSSRNMWLSEVGRSALFGN